MEGASFQDRRNHSCGQGGKTYEHKMYWESATPRQRACPCKAELTVDSLGTGTCPDPIPVLHQGPPQKPLPLTLKSKKTLQVVFDVTFDCANAPAKGAGHQDYRYTATVDHAALDGNPDTHPEDDSCPRDPLGMVPNPDGTINDQGCAAEVTDMVQK
jgi:hypothetical protein